MKQREIRFRCWANKKMWAYAVPRLSPAHNGGMIEVSDRPDGAFNQFVNGVLMQFTGLYDKHGKEVFEGDVVKQDKYIGYVEYDIHTASFKGVYEYKQHKIEIIGNVFEHPELLEQNHD